MLSWQILDKYTIFNALCFANIKIKYLEYAKKIIFYFQAFDRIKGYLSHAKSSPNLTVIAGGNCDNR
jgi:hypothetical protein